MSRCIRESKRFMVGRGVGLGGVKRIPRLAQICFVRRRVHVYTLVLISLMLVNIRPFYEGGSLGIPQEGSTATLVGSYSTLRFLSLVQHEICCGGAAQDYFPVLQGRVSHSGKEPWSSFDIIVSVM